ncbi:MAG: phage GP46 family protein [Rhodospirillales bacterium]
MTDIKTVFNADIISGDIAIKNGLLDDDDGLKTALVISIFTDRRALPDDELPDPNGSRRGWVGDAFPPVIDGVPQTGDRIGSRLWLLHREKQLLSVVARAREYLEEATDWLIEDGICNVIEIEVEIVRDGVLGFEVRPIRPNKDPVAFRFDYVWRAEAAEVTGYAL